MVNWLVVIVGVVMMFGVITHNLITDGKLEPPLDKLGFDDLIKSFIFILGIILIFAGFFWKVTGSKNNQMHDEA